MYVAMYLYAITCNQLQRECSLINLIIQMDARCAGTDRRKRTTQSLGLVQRPNRSVIRRKRQSAASLRSVAQTEIDCLTSLVSSLHHETIAMALCMNATIAAPCDDSVIVGR